MNKEEKAKYKTVYRRKNPGESGYVEVSVRESWLKGLLKASASLEKWATAKMEGK